jgi:hypothetical protein
MENKQSGFTPMYVRHVTWAILDDSRQFFSTYLTKSKFELKEDLPFTALSVLSKQICVLQSIERSDFPAKWKILANTNTQGSNHEEGGDWISQSTPKGGRRGREETPRTFDQNIGWLPGNKVHEKIQNMMGGYRHKFGQIRMTDIMKANNTSINKLPKLEKYTKDGRNTLCTHNLLGRCTNKLCPLIHEDSIKLPTSYVTEFCTMLEPGIKKLVAASDDEQFNKRGRWGNKNTNKYIKQE